MRRRARERSGRFVAEGEDLLKAADAAGWEPLERFSAAGSGLPGVEVEPRLLARASGLASGTRTLAVYRERWVPGARGPLCVYLHGVQDPGNVGAVLRSGEAFGASCVVLGAGSADPFSPKAVRASMGAVFSVPVARAAEAASDARSADALPGLKIALVPGAGPPLAELWRADPTEVTLMIGSERQGLPQELVDQADSLAHIPVRIDSLNAAMAATVALYEVTRMARR